jgi:hypothetical protein
MPNVDLFGFAVLLGDIAPTIEVIDGRLFLDRSGSGPEALRASISKYADAREAQRWLNLAPIDDLIDCAVADWSMEDEALELIAEIYRRSWLAIIHARYGDVPYLSVDLLKDEESGDVLLRLTQE